MRPGKENSQRDATRDAGKKMESGWVGGKRKGKRRAELEMEMTETVGSIVRGTGTRLRMFQTVRTLHTVHVLGLPV